MLINFSFANFRSYRDEQQFSMIRPTGAQKRETRQWERMDVSTVAGIYGGNASGKSAFMDAARLLCRFVSYGFDPNFDLAAELTPFKLDRQSRKEPSLFSIEFVADDSKRYTYDLALTQNEVVYECLRSYNGNRARLLFERETDEDGVPRWRYGREFTGARKTFERMTRPEAPYLAVLHAANVAVVAPVWDFFRNRVGFFQAEYYDTELRYIRDGLKKGTPLARALTGLMARSDLGISLVQTKDLLEELHESSMREGDPREGGYEDLASGLLALSQPELSREERRERAHSIASTPPEPLWELSFTHRAANGIEAAFAEEDESRGTLAALAFFSLALRLLGTCSVGFVDEIDSSLHPTFVQELVALFRDPACNPHQSQLIFTTHDVSLITRTGADVRVLDQDQIWFTEKDANGCSTLFPVTAIPTRWDENFGRNYLHGIYGAVPHPDFHEAFAQAVSELCDVGDGPDAGPVGGDA